MQVSVEKLPKSQVKITVTVPAADLPPYLDRAAAKLSEQIKIEGFRPGKAPRALIEEKAGVMSVLQEAIDEIVQKTYPQAIAEQKLKDIGMPHIDIQKLAPENDVVYTATVALLPAVQLAELKHLKAERKAPAVEPEEIEKALVDLQKMMGKEIATMEPASTGDKVVSDIQVFVDNVAIEGGTSKQHPVVLGSGAFIPGFEEQIAGIKKDEHKEFELEFPKEYHQENLAGKKATFKVHATDVFKIQLPALDDELAKGLGKFTSLDELKKELEKNIVTEKEQKEKERLELEVLEQMIERSTFDELPELLIDNELDRMLQEMEQNLQMQGGTFDDYLQHIKKTREELRAEWRGQAEKRVKTALVVAEVITAQNLTVPEAAIDEAIEVLKTAYAGQTEIMSQLESLDYRAYQRTILLNRRAVEWLVLTALGEDPAAPVVKDGKTKSGIIVG